MVDVCETSNPYEAGISFHVGNVVRILLHTSRATFKIGSIEAQTRPAIKLRQVHFLYDERGSPIAYATWAFLEPSTGSELVEDGSRFLHFSEWNEGTELWIMDFVAPFGHALKLAQHLRRGPLKGYGIVNWSRERRCGQRSHIRRQVQDTLSPRCR